MDYLYFLPPLFISALFIYLFLKKRNKLVELGDQEAEPIRGTKEDRERDERELNRAALNPRELYLETMDLQARFITREGYSQIAMDQLLAKLREADIACDIYLQASGPMGFADNMIEQQGIFELYVERGKREAANEVIKAWA